jgi:hypothetical protein
MRHVRRLIPLLLLIGARDMPAFASSFIGTRGQTQQGSGPATEDVAFLETVLVDPLMPDLIRRGAAERLALAEQADADRALERAIRAGGAPRDAALDALDKTFGPVTSPRVDGGGDGAGGRDEHAGKRRRTRPLGEELTRAIVEVAIAAGGPNPAPSRAVATRVLARATPDASERIAAAALDATMDLERRRGAVAALGEIRSRAAVRRLIELLDEERREDRELVNATVAALERATGESPKASPAAWREWWSDLGAADQVDEAQMRALAAAAAEAEQALADETRRGVRLEARLVEAYDQLFLRLTREERLARGAALLSDEVDTVRSFAIGQLERMLRNGERADDRTRDAALVVLDDPVPALRARGARLLADLGVADIALRLAERLPTERDASVAAVYLSVLASAPEPRTFSALVGLLKDPVLNEAATRTVIALADAGRLPAEWQASVLPPLRDVVAKRPNSAAVQLLAMAGEDEDLQRALTLLDAPDASVRRGAAEGLRRRGLRRPILDRANDPAIYGPLVAAIADEPKTLDTIRLLVNAVPPADMTVDWNAAVARVLRELPVSDLPAADRLLSQVPAIERRTRRDGLARLLSSARAGATRETLADGLPRWVDLLVADGRGYIAIDQLEALAPKAGDPIDAPLIDALFRAKALSGDFRGAATIAPEPSRWIELLAATVGSPLVARPLADEIALRFGKDMSGDQRSLLERLRKQLPTATSTSEDDGRSP